MLPRDCRQVFTAAALRRRYEYPARHRDPLLSGYLHFYERESEAQEAGQISKQVEQLYAYF